MVNNGKDMVLGMQAVVPEIGLCIHDKQRVRQGPLISRSLDVLQRNTESFDESTVFRSSQNAGVEEFRRNSPGFQQPGERPRAGQGIGVRIVVREDRKTPLTTANLNESLDFRLIMSFAHHQ